MPSIFGHAIIGLSTARVALAVNKQVGRPSSSQTTPFSPQKVYLLSVVASTLPDFDALGFALAVPYDSLLGHRGITHSILFSSVIGIVSTLVYFKTRKFSSLFQWYWVIYFSLVAFSHPALDALTTGGHGIALFSPFNEHRYFHFFRPIAVSPLGWTDFITLGGLKVIVNELLLLGIPCLCWVQLARLLSGLQIFRISAVSCGLGIVLFFQGICREELLPRVNGVDVYKIEPTLSFKRTHGINELPTEDLPGHQLILNYNELIEKHLLNTPLIPKKIPWSAAYYPIWLGGAAGRWQEPFLKRIWNSLWTESYLSRPEILELIHSDSHEAFQLSPTEKYDLAVGDYYLNTTRSESKARGRQYVAAYPNTKPWEGYCHSIGLASLLEDEPKQEVKVLNPDGYEITFHPNDIKALLGVAYFFLSGPHWDLGNRCELDGPKNENCIDVDPAALVVAITNLVGIERTSFLVNKEPFQRIRNAAIRKAEIKVVNSPYFPGDRKAYFDVDDPFIQALVDVEIHLTVTKLGAVLSESEEEELIYQATLGLDSKMNLAGGRWEDPFHHPDFVWGSSRLNNEPALFGTVTKANERLAWPILKSIAKQSASTRPQEAPIEISTLSSQTVRHGLSFSSSETGIFGRISYLNYANPIEAYGYIAGTAQDAIVSGELIQDKGSTQTASSSRIASIQISSRNANERRFFHLKTTGSLEDQEGLKLRFSKKGSAVEFLLPSKRKFESTLDPSVGYP